MKKVQHGKSETQNERNTKQMQHEKSATHRKVQHEKGTRRKKCNMKIVQY